MAIPENTLLVCPVCGNSCPIHDHRHRQWRHLDTCQFLTLDEADVPRVSCPEHGCQTLPVPWAEKVSRYTLLFEMFVLSWLKISTVDAVRKQLKLSWNTVDNIMRRAVNSEVAFKKGHEYIAVISDTYGQVLTLEDNRGVESLSRYFNRLSNKQLTSIKTISMDMSLAYISATRIHLERVYLCSAYFNRPTLGAT